MFDLLFGITAVPISLIAQAEPQWIQVTDSAVDSVYLDANSFRGRNNYRTVTLLQRSKIGEKSIRSVFYIKCKSRKKALLANLPDHDVSKLDRKKLIYPEPESLGIKMVNITCPRVIKK